MEPQITIMLALISCVFLNAYLAKQRGKQLLARVRSKQKDYN